MTPSPFVRLPTKHHTKQTHGVREPLRLWKSTA